MDKHGTGALCWGVWCKCVGFFHPFSSYIMMHRFPAFFEEKKRYWRCGVTTFFLKKLSLFKLSNFLANSCIQVLLSITLLFLSLDIDECERPETYSCYGSCQNTNGSFNCLCPSGTYGNPFTSGGCLRIKKSFTGWQLLCVHIHYFHF